MAGSLRDAFSGKEDVLKKKGLMSEDSPAAPAWRPSVEKVEKREKRGGQRPAGRRRDEEGVRRVLPLYREIRELKKGDDGFFIVKHGELFSTAHTGLIFDKYCDVWAGPEKKWKPETPKDDKAVKQQLLDRIVKHFKDNKGVNDLLKQHHERRALLLADCSGKAEQYTTTWRFVSGLGMGHVLETGFVWHQILGVPYLPGSSVKGLVRAWAEKWQADSEDDVTRLFGPSPEKARTAPGTGALIVFDAIPEKKPIIEVDIMNPHYGPYYQDKTKTIPPADYFSPVPIFFLTVASGTPFLFGLAPRPGSGAKDDLDKGFELLNAALATIGAGAKTAVGYGYFEQTTREERVSESR